MSLNYINLPELSEAELLSLTFNKSLESPAVRSILTKINTLEELLYLTEYELHEIAGIKRQPAVRFIAAMELAKRIYSAPSRIPQYISSPQDAADYFMPQLRFMDREVFKCLYLNRKGHSLFSETISIGGLSSSIVHPREVFKSALKKSAASVILCHNHPSGDPTPSKEDIEITKRISEAGTLLGIEVLDHLIIGDGIWKSISQLGLMA